MNKGVRLITILSAVLLVSVSLAWTDSITVRLASGQAHLDIVGSPEATPLAMIIKSSAAGNALMTGS